MRILLALILALAAGSVFAADGVPARKTVIIAPQPASNAGLRPRLATPAPAPVISLPVASQTDAAFAGQSFAINGLAGGGLRSGLSSLDDARGQCRNACASSRFTCDAGQEDSDCAGRWVVCTARCGH
jgi:hypothetical protein